MLVQREIDSAPAFTKDLVGTSPPSPFLGRRKAVIGLASMAVSALAAPHVSRAATRRVRFGHNGAPDSLFGLGGEAFANAVAADPVLGIWADGPLGPPAQYGCCLGSRPVLSEVSDEGEIEQQEGNPASKTNALTIADSLPTQHPDANRVEGMAM